MKNVSFESIMARKNEIMKNSVGIDYDKYEYGEISFDYEKMMEDVGYSLEDIINIQKDAKVGNTHIYELKNLNKLIDKKSEKGKGARIFLKDEAENASGSFKARRASLSAYHARENNYKGMIAATSGNYGSAVASQANQKGLNCIIAQEVFDSKKIGQPEILEKTRKCEAYGAEVLQLTVGPELFYMLLKLLEETNYFNASLYTPFGIAGVETLGYEIAQDMQSVCGKAPDAVVATHAGGGNITGTARGLIKAGAKNTKVIGASVDLSGLHMASDTDFNKKSFTTGHTGFGVPMATWPDRSDVPRSAARSLRYMDRYVTVSQGEVFYITEALAQLEGLERGPAGNTSLAAAVSLAQEMNEDETIVVQETEYTGAGKHPISQLNFAKNNGIKVKRGNPEHSIPGENIVIPENLDQFKINDINVDNMKSKYIENAIKKFGKESIFEKDVEFLIKDTNTNRKFVKEVLNKRDVIIKK